MYRICVVGVDKKNVEHFAYTREFEYYEDTTALIGAAIEDVSDAPFFCVAKRLFVKPVDAEVTGEYLFTSEHTAVNACEGNVFVRGWVQRDVLTPDDEDSDNEVDGIAAKYNELAAKYNELAAKYNELASRPPFIIGPSAEIEKIEKRRKLFI